MMGKKLTDQKARIAQRSIGFELRQLDFFAEHPDFKPDIYCRQAVDDQIKLIDPQFSKHEAPINQN